MKKKDGRKEHISSLCTVGQIIQIMCINISNGFIDMKMISSRYFLILSGVVEVTFYSKMPLNACKSHYNAD